MKAPHDGSHEFRAGLLAAVDPWNSVVTSSEIPDQGHPRENFLGRPRFGRGPQPLLFSNEFAALFVDVDDPEAVSAGSQAPTIGTR